MFDLEDSVALSEKDSARMLVAHALQHPLYREMETLVRVNPLTSEYGLADLNAAVRAGASGASACPKPMARKTSPIWKPKSSALSAIAAAKWAAR